MNKGQKISLARALKKRFGVNYRQYQVMECLGREPSTRTKIAATLGLTCPCVTHVTDGLILADLIKMKPINGQLVELALSAKGRRKLQEIQDSGFFDKPKHGLLSSVSEYSLYGGVL